MSLPRGAQVEIAPFRGGRCFASYAEYDGCHRVIVNLKGYGPNLKARVDVQSAVAGCSGGMDVPAQALRVLPG